MLSQLKFYFLLRGYYTADVTSYDYDCPISEAGDYGEKYYAIRKSLDSHGFHVPEVYRSTITKARSYKPLEYKDGFYSLWDMLHTGMQTYGKAKTNI